MSQTLDQIYIANPATSFQSTDLFYLVRSPYTPGNDFACTYATLVGSLPSSTWIDVASSPQAMIDDTGYITDNGASLVTYTLPATCPQGGIIEISGKSSGGWIISLSGGKTIQVGNQLASTSVASTGQFDYIKLLCITANTTFNVIGGVGNFTIV